MSKVTRETVRYSISFKQKVVREVESGLGIDEVRRRYGIGGCSTVQKWIEKFGKNHLLNKIVRVETMEDRDQVKLLKKEVQNLKMALADSLLAQRCLEQVIEEANREYKADLKKILGQMCCRARRNIAGNEAMSLFRFQQTSILSGGTAGTNINRAERYVA
jgi:transposase-like protein